jgi:hypothetical protein
LETVEVISLSLEIFELDLREIGWADMYRINLAQNREQWLALVNMADETSGSIKCWKILELLSGLRLLKKASAEVS